jgi:XTP/dITP diphosphohydrolase
VVEDAATFEENAIKKAVSLSRWILRQHDWDVLKNESDDVWILADDSGLEVDALNRAPGVFSARFAVMDGDVPDASGNAFDSDNNAKLLRSLAKMSTAHRQARFRCVLALVRLSTGKDINQPVVFEGVCEGSIALQPGGHAGFGYDPLFIPNGFNQSFAELGEDLKKQISHRSRALALFREFMEQN